MGYIAEFRSTWKESNRQLKSLRARVLEMSPSWIKNKDENEDIITFLPPNNNTKTANDLKNSSSEIENNSNSSAAAAAPKGAVDPETGEINWDCPCLESALKPPCGEFFKAAFKCFVESKAEPRGEDCLEQFIKMQDCFKAHPEVYMQDEQDVEDFDKEGNPVTPNNPLE